MQNLGIITDPSTFRSTIEQICTCGWCAVDTEFLREKTYFPELCLIQVATPELIACIDPLQLPDLEPLQNFLVDSTVVKVMHASSQDLEVLFLSTGKLPRPLFDTQIAASLLGYGEQLGYAQLVVKILNHELDKSQTRTNWATRPISKEQLQYALDDVRYLMEIYPKLVQEMEVLGRMGWMEEEVKSLLEPEKYQAQPEQAWKRVSGHQRASPRELLILRELAAWREKMALKKNRPRRWIMKDASLMHLARFPPMSISELTNIPEVPTSFLRINASEILEAICRGKEESLEYWPNLRTRFRPTVEEEKWVDSALEQLQTIAQKQRISFDRLASKKEIFRYLFPNASESKDQLPAKEALSKLSQGWRYPITSPVLDSIKAKIDTHVRHDSK